MLSRHPCYEEYLKNFTKIVLTASEVRISPSPRGLTLEGIASELNLSLDVVLQIAKSLCDEVLHAAPISKAMWSYKISIVLQIYPRGGL